MKKLELKQMENVEGGLIPSGGQVTCFAISSVISFLNPVGGLIIGGMCLFVN